MNKAKTLKRNLGNPQPFLSVAWDTEDIPSQVSINLTLKWRDIDWRRAMKNVFKLQKLIYRASSCGKIRKMPRYQKLLTKSYYPLLLTVRWVRQDNQVKNTVGVDGIKNLPPIQRFNFVYLLKSHSLKAILNPRVSILKQGLNAKFSLSIPTMYDRALQGSVKLSMEPEWEKRFEPNSYGLGLGRSTNDAIEIIFTSIKNKSKYFLDVDISKCFDLFDLINHDALLGKIKKSSYRRLIKQCLKSRVLDNNQFYPPQQLLFTYPDSFLLGNRCGLVELDTAQGEVMSPLLANITLHGIEKRLMEFAKTLDLKNKKGAQMSWQSKCQSLILVDYVDEFVILQEDIKVLLQAKTVMQEWLNQVRLELKQELTRIANALEEYKGNKPGLDFFGFTMRQGQAKIAKLGFQTLIKLSARSIKTHYRKLAERFDSYKIAPVKGLIAKLNPAISGWVNYFSTQVSTNKIFNKLDMLLWKRLWCCASRQHPNNSATWVKQEYFPNIENGNWILPRGEYMLNQYSDVPIIGDIKVKDNNLTLDGDWNYWTSRVGKYSGVKTETSKLFKSQKNKCAFCGLTFRVTDLIEVNYVIPKFKGGDNILRNKQLLHQYCHETNIALNHKSYLIGNSQDLPEYYLWVNDMLTLKQGCTLELGPLTEEPDEAKVSCPVLKTSRVG